MNKILWKAEFYQKLADLINLSYNWDSYGASSIDRSIIANAENLIPLFMSYDVPVPLVAPIPGKNGSILQFEWRIDNRELEVELHKDKSIEYLKVINTETGPIYEEENKVNNSKNEFAVEFMWYDLLKWINGKD